MALKKLWVRFEVWAGAPSCWKMMGSLPYSASTHGATSLLRRCMYTPVLTFMPALMKIRGIFLPLVVTSAHTLTEAGFWQWKWLRTWRPECLFTGTKHLVILDVEDGLHCEEFLVSPQKQGNRTSRKLSLIAFVLMNGKNKAKQTKKQISLNSAQKIWFPLLINTCEKTFLRKHYKRKTLMCSLMALKRINQEENIMFKNTKKWHYL